MTVLADGYWYPPKLTSGHRRPSSTERLIVTSSWYCSSAALVSASSHSLQKCPRVQFRERSPKGSNEGCAREWRGVLSAWDSPYM